MDLAADMVRLGSNVLQEIHRPLSKWGCFRAGWMNSSTEREINSTPTCTRETQHRISVGLISGRSSCRVIRPLRPWLRPLACNWSWEYFLPGLLQILGLSTTSRLACLCRLPVPNVLPPQISESRLHLYYELRPMPVGPSGRRMERRSPGKTFRHSGVEPSSGST